MIPEQLASSLADDDGVYSEDYLMKSLLRGPGGGIGRGYSRSAPLVKWPFYKVFAEPGGNMSQGTSH